jgi:mRNA interferase RelE/StbE
LKYKIKFRPHAVKEIKVLSLRERTRIMGKIEDLADNLSGDVKRLTNFTPEFRMKVGDYRSNSR